MIHLVKREKVNFSILLELHDYLPAVLLQVADMNIQPELERQHRSMIEKDQDGNYRILGFYRLSKFAQPITHGQLKYTVVDYTGR